MAEPPSVLQVGTRGGSALLRQRTCAIDNNRVGAACFNRAMSDDVALVLAWIEASQRARNSQRPEDFDALRRFLADDVQVKLASPWTDSPWRIAYTSANQIVDRLNARSTRDPP